MRLCFTFGSVVAHILTASVVRRQTVIDALRGLGSQIPRRAIPSNGNACWRREAEAL
jgi:hypothetical protein